jgi:hypothetical protein
VSWCSETPEKDIIYINKTNILQNFTCSSSVADPDPGSGALLTPGSGMGKKSGSGSGMNNPDHISESLKQLFGLK